MKLKEKRQSEREEQKKKREQLMIEAAIDCFSEKSIEQVTMNEIAERANLGVATLYRYFDTKEQLSFRCSVYLWNIAREFYLTRSETAEFRQKNGIEQMRDILLLSVEFFEQRPVFFRFMYDFDNYLAAHKLESEYRAEYENMMGKLVQIFGGSVKAGIADESVKVKANEDEIYFCLTHALFSMMQKLASNGNLLEVDKRVTMRRQIELLIDILIKGLQVES